MAGSCDVDERTQDARPNRRQFIAVVGPHPFSSNCRRCLAKLGRKHCVMRCFGVGGRGDCGWPLRSDVEVAELQCETCRTSASPMPPDDAVALLAAAVVRRAFDDLAAHRRAATRSRARMFLEYSLWRPGFLWGEILGHAMIQRRILDEVRHRAGSTAMPASTRWRSRRSPEMPVGSVT